MQGDLGWRKLEERREEMKLLLGKRLERMKRDSTGEDGGETMRGWRNGVVGRV